MYLIFRYIKRYKESVVYQTVSLSSALVEGTMTGNKKIMCKICYREMRRKKKKKKMKKKRMKKKN